MSKFKRFLTITLRSALDFSYYNDIFQSKLSFSLKYYALLILLLQIIVSVVLSLRIASIMPTAPYYVTQVKSILKSVYPKELVITINNGQTHVNVDEPYFINIPEKLTRNLTPFQYLLVIDTQAQASDINQYDTLALLTKQELVVVENSTDYRLYPLSDIKGYYIINREIYEYLLDKLNPYLDRAPNLLYFVIAFVLLLWPVISGIFIFAARLFYLFFIAFFVFIFTKLLNKSIKYGKIYQLAIHASTIPILVSYLIILPPLSFSLILILLIGVILPKLKEWETKKF